jgi:hypothetical protein
MDEIKDRVSRCNEIALEPRTALVHHPTVLTTDGKNSFFWGETHLGNHDGHERFHRGADEFLKAYKRR